MNSFSCSAETNVLWNVKVAYSVQLTSFWIKPRAFNERWLLHDKLNEITHRWHFSQEPALCRTRHIQWRKTHFKNLLQFWHQKWQLENVTMSNMHRKCYSYTCMTAGEIKASWSRETPKSGIKPLHRYSGFPWALAIDYVMDYNVFDRHKYPQFVMNK